MHPSVVFAENFLLCNKIVVMGYYEVYYVLQAS